MKLDVFFTPAGLMPTEVQGRTVFVIDILRATTDVRRTQSRGQGADPGPAAALGGHPVLPHFHERRVTLTPVPV